MLPQPPEISTTAMSVALGKAAARAETSFSSASDLASSRGAEVCRRLDREFLKIGARLTGTCSVGRLPSVHIGILPLYCWKDANDRLEILGSGSRRLRARQNILAV